MTKIKIQKVTEPPIKLTQDEWFKEFGVSSGYTKPTKYFQGNELDTRKFVKADQDSQVSWHEYVQLFFNSLITFEWVGIRY
jgi:hypothetical protein